MFYRNTKWAERFAASQAAGYQPGMQKRPWRLLKYGREDFDTSLEFFWFYMHFFTISLGCFLTLGIIVIIISLYVHPRQGVQRPEWRPLVLSLLPSIAILVWMSIDGTYSSLMKARPKTRLAVEVLVVGGTATCVIFLGIVTKGKAEESNWYTNWDAALTAMLGILVLVRLTRLVELILEIRKASGYEESEQPRVEV